eukprot:gene5628-7003_t
MISITSLNERGKIELARLILYYSDYEFQDIQLESIPPELKSLIPGTGSLPIFKDEYQNLTFYNPTAIARYLAKKFNLYGSNDTEQSISNDIVDSIWSLLQPFVNEKN